MAKGKRLKEPKRRKKAKAAAGEGEPAEGQVTESVETALAEQAEPEPAQPPVEPEQPVPPVEEVLPVEIPLEAAEGEAEEGEGEDEELEAEGEGEEETEKKKLRKGMSRSRRILGRPFTRAATRRAIDPQFWEDAEDALIAADAGVESATAIVEAARKRILSEGVRDIEGVRQVFREEVAAMLRSFGERPQVSEKPHVIFIVGVNGVGKTTTSAKIGHQYKSEGFKVLFAAADTFRAAGIEQMEMWAQRVGAPVVRHKTGGDPAAVVFDALESATARGIEIVIVDTAGRLHTKKNLMDELNKMWRVAERQLGYPPESILVIDATTGQNGVSQARIFGEAMEIGSIALTKMDGSAKGGVVLAIGRELGIPVSYIGVGESMSDLRPFDPDDYARALF